MKTTEVVLNNDAPMFVAWVSMGPYQFGWVKDHYSLHTELTLDPQEAKRLDTYEAGRLAHSCNVNGVACHIFCANAEVVKKEIP